MPVHSCKRCGYKTAIKTHLKKHYGRKYTCTNLLTGPSAEECLHELYSTNPAMTSTPLTNHSQITAKHCDSYVCQFCNMVFTRKDNMRNHIKKSCKHITKTYSEDDVKSLLDDKDRQLKIKNDLLAEMRKQLTTLLNIVGNITNKK